MSKYLDADLLHALHVYKGNEYTHEITIRHLLKQTSGMFDNFWPLLKKMLADDSFNITPGKSIHQFGR